MTQYCIHHPTIPAHWLCPKCSSAFCPECIVRRQKAPHKGSGSLHLCPRCMQEAEWIGAENIIQPFWNRIPKLFAYPFSLNAVCLIALVAFASAIFSGPGLIQSLIRMLLWGVLLKYAYASLQATARGDLRPPPIDEKTISEDFFQVFKQLILFFLLGMGFVLIAANLGFFPAILYVIVAVLFLPAMIILLVTTGRLTHAVNPVLFISLALRIGWGYFLMYLFLILLGSAPAVLAHYLFAILPAGFASFIASLGSNYYTLLSYHLMGYVILQYHQQIGYSVDYEDFRYDEASARDTGIKEDPGDPVAREVAFHMKEGRHDEALGVLRRAKAQRGLDGLQQNDMYYELLAIQKEKEEMRHHAPVLLEQLVLAGQKEKACKVYLDAVAGNPEADTDPTVLLRMGTWLNEQGNSRKAIGALNRLVKSHPTDPLVPKALFLCARIYGENLENPEKATRILNVLLKRFPDHDFAAQAEYYIKQVRVS